MKQTKIRVIYNQKGGVGKTTLAVNLAALSAAAGRRTLLVDSDPQGNSTTYLLGSSAKPTKNLADYYESCLGVHLFRPQLMEFVTTDTGVPHLHLVPGSRDLEELRNKLENKHKILKLREGIKNTSYDCVYFDPPPANDFFALSCLIAASEVLVPIDCDTFSVQAARDICQLVEEVRADHNPDLKILGLIVNQYQKNSRHAAHILKDLETLGMPILTPYIPQSVKVRESHSDFRPVVLSQPKNPVSLAMSALHDTYLADRPQATNRHNKQSAAEA
jgi:chromosome partitioning protein